MLDHSITQNKMNMYSQKYKIGRVLTNRNFRKTVKPNTLVLMNAKCGYKVQARPINNSRNNIVRNHLKDILRPNRNHKTSILSDSHMYNDMIIVAQKDAITTIKVQTGSTTSAYKRPFINDGIDIMRYTNSKLHHLSHHNNTDLLSEIMTECRKKIYKFQNNNQGSPNIIFMVHTCRDRPLHHPTGYHETMHGDTKPMVIRKTIFRILSYLTKHKGTSPTKKALLNIENKIYKNQNVNVTFGNTTFRLKKIQKMHNGKPYKLFMNISSNKNQNTYINKQHRSNNHLTRLSRIKSYDSSTTTTTSNSNNNQNIPTGYA